MKKIAIYIVIATLVIIQFFTHVLYADACTACGYVDDNCYTLTYHFYTPTDGKGGHQCYFYDIYDADDFIYDFYVTCGARFYLVIASSVDMDIATGTKNGNSFMCSWGGSSGGRQMKNFVYTEIPYNFIDWEFDDNFQSYAPRNTLSLDNINEFGDYFNSHIDEFTPSFEPDGSLWEGISYDAPEMKYDFSLDVYNKNIPLPEIYDITYDTFKVKNKNLYGVDILVDLQLNTVDVSMDGPYYFKDTGKAFKKNHYNFTVSPKQWFNDGIVNVKDMYGVDIAQWYLTAWRELIATYPKYQDLPSFSWLKYGGASGPSGYESIRNIDGNLASTNNDVFKSMYAVPFQTTFYVRFYNPVNMDVGQWVQVKAKNNVKETLTDVGIVLQGKPQEIGLGSVEGTTATGNLVIKDKETYSYDWDTDNYIPKVEYETGDVDWEVSITNLKTVTSMFGAFPSFVAICFSWLPSWITALIGSAITICVAMAIYHAIRG